MEARTREDHKREEGKSAQLSPEQQRKQAKREKRKELKRKARAKAKRTAERAAARERSSMEKKTSMGRRHLWGRHPWRPCQRRPWSRINEAPAVRCAASLARSSMWKGHLCGKVIYGTCSPDERVARNPGRPCPTGPPPRVSLRSPGRHLWGRHPWRPCRRQRWSRVNYQAPTTAPRRLIGEVIYVERSSMGPVARMSA
jgi:hypothetical protein